MIEGGVTKTWIIIKGCDVVNEVSTLSLENRELLSRKRFPQMGPMQGEYELVKLQCRRYLNGSYMAQI